MRGMRGRYPVPLTYEDVSGSARFSDSKQYSLSWFGGDDIERLKRLVQTIRTELNLYTLRGKKAFGIDPPAVCMSGHL
jgi:hypothetical protein